MRWRKNVNEMKIHAEPNDNNKLTSVAVYLISLVICISHWKKRSYSLCPKCFIFLLFVWINNPFSSLCSIHTEKMWNILSWLFVWRWYEMRVREAAIFKLFSFSTDSKFIFHEQIFFLKTKKKKILN